MNDNVNKDNNNEKYILEYPENYEEICEMALKKLDFDYANVLKCEFKENTEKKVKIDVKEYISNDEEEDKSVGEENKRNQYVQLDEEDEDIQNEEPIQEEETINTEVKEKEEKKEEKIKHINNIIKNPEKIKEMIKKIKYPTPKWAENLSDEDFILKIKQIEIE